MIRTLIIDDEKNNSELIENLLGMFCPNIEVIGIAESVKDAYQKIQELKPELVFLDIRLNDGTAFDLLRCFQEFTFKVVFITAHSEYAIDAFKIAALDYILKPVSPAAIIQAVSRASEILSKEELTSKMNHLLDLQTPKTATESLVLKTHDRIYHLSPEEVIRIEADGSYCTVCLNNGHKIVLSRLLKEFEEQLGTQGFIRVHQSHLVNLKYVFFFDKSECTLILKDESRIPVSSRKKDYVLGLL